MQLLDLFARQRVLAYMISAAIMLFGIIGLQGIGLDRNPNVEPPSPALKKFSPTRDPVVPW